MISLKISELTHEFEDREVLSSIDFNFDGACLAVTGPNGSGKSTLIKIIAGILTPTYGDVSLHINGEVVPRDAIRDVIGMAAPNVCLYNDLTPRENFRFLMKVRSSNYHEDRIDEVLEEVGLIDRANDQICELSSGLRQRACLGAALIHRPQVLLLDEPSTNLDEAGIIMLRRVIERQSMLGMVVLATNDSSEVKLASQCLDLGIAR